MNNAVSYVWDVTVYLAFWTEISKTLINFSVTRHVNKQQSVKSKAIESSI